MQIVTTNFFVHMHPVEYAGGLFYKLLETKNSSLVNHNIINHNTISKKIKINKLCPLIQLQNV